MSFDVSSPTAAPVACRAYVTGRVQGVFYRASTREQARLLGLRGYARNLPDGRVEVLICGAAPEVERLIAWLWVGPTAAKVTDVSVTALEAAGIEIPADFRTA